MFRCEICNSEVERNTTNGRRQRSCGCKTHYGHGMSRSREYTIWSDMKGRCDSDHHRYGGRGISYTPKWNTFLGFWEDMKEGYSKELTIDRIDVDGNYTKENCQWISMPENAGKDHKGRIQSREWVLARTSKRIRVSSTTFLKIKEDANNGMLIKDICKKYKISRDALNGAEQRAQEKVKRNYRCK